MADFDKKVDEVRGTAKRTPVLGKGMAKWSALRAVAASPLPVVGPIFGAIAGAAYAYHKGTKNR